MNKLSVYEPFKDVFPELMRGFFDSESRQPSGPAPIRVDLKESAEQYLVEAEIPGVPKEDIKVEIDGNRVSISAEVKKSSDKKEGDKIIWTERYQGSVARSFQVGVDIDEARATATYEGGVLHLTLPKKAGKSSRRLAIS